LNMAGGNETYEGSLAMNSIEFFGLPVISIGITRPKSNGYKEIVKKDPGKNIYKKIVLKDGVIAGVVFVNSIENIGIIGALIKNKVDVTSIKDIMLEDYFDYGKIAPLIKKSERGFKEPEFKETIMTLIVFERSCKLYMCAESRIIIWGHHVKDNCNMRYKRC